MFRPRCILLVLLLIFVSSRGQVEEEDKRDLRRQQSSEGPLAVLKEKYTDLPPPGKFAATAVTGFAGSRLALKAFVGAAKVAGATFIA